LADRTIKLRELRRILAGFGIEEDSSKGKGSHTVFIQRDSDGKVIAQYTVPTNRNDLLVCYVRGCRKRFGLKVEDGTSDDDFYGK
jgi:hypothetical protein